MIRIGQIKININSIDHDEELKNNIRRMLRIDRFDSYTIVKKSIDARKKPELYYVYTVDVAVANENQVLKKSKCKSATIANPVIYNWPEGRKSNYRPVIVGMGPAGLFCGYMLAKAGCKPIICERGQDVDTRSEDVEKFWESGVLDTESNVQFGEGGAGTFSDGKLNTLVNDKFGRNREVLSIFIENGAPGHIIYDSKPHIGTDVLKLVVKNMRNRIISWGGEVRFGSKLTAIKTNNDNVTAVFNDCDELTTDALVLAIGHSARDTFKMLLDTGLHMEAKSFAVGMRVMHPQKLIDGRQYGEDNLDKNLPASPYKLTYHSENGRGVYSFCMCPGGYVVNASSESGMTAVNGMSYSDRASSVANSAIIVSVSPEDFGGDGPLAGVEFQRALERKAYNLAGGKIPYEFYGDYKSAVTNTSVKVNKTDPVYCFKGEAVEAEVHSIMPKALNEAFVEGIDDFDRIIPGFASPDMVLAGIESRTSSPVRINRDETHQSSFKHIYPCGEGAGYAGGIMSAAMDGMLIAEEIWKR